MSSSSQVWLELQNILTTPPLHLMDVTPGKVVLIWPRASLNVVGCLLFFLCEAI